MQSESSAAALLNRFAHDFGPEAGVAYFNRGLSIYEARREHSKKRLGYALSAGELHVRRAPSDPLGRVRGSGEPARAAAFATDAKPRRTTPVDLERLKALEAERADLRRQLAREEKGGGVRMAKGIKVFSSQGK